LKESDLIYELGFGMIPRAKGLGLWSSSTDCGLRAADFPQSGIDFASKMNHLAVVFVSSVLIAIDNFLV